MGHCLCSVDCASLYDLVNETNLVHNLFLVYFVNFIYNLYIFQTSPCPSSGGTTVFMQYFILIILYSCLSGMGYQTVSYTERWNTLKINCTPTWFHKQDYSGTSLPNFQWGDYTIEKQRSPDPQFEQCLAGERLLQQEMVYKYPQLSHVQWC